MFQKNFQFLKYKHFIYFNVSLKVTLYKTHPPMRGKHFFLFECLLMTFIQYMLKYFAFFSVTAVY